MVSAYLRERFHLRLFVPLAIFIAIAASGGAAAWDTFAIDTGFALLLLAQFRIWDDLADRSRDAVTHPTRVLVRAPQVTPVIALCGALAVLNICTAVWRDGTGVAVAVLAVLNGVLGAWYLARTSADGGLESRHARRSAAGDHLLLAKYPAMLVVVAGARVTSAPLQILLAAAALYAAVCAYEVWHDPSSPMLGKRTTGEL